MAYIEVYNDYSALIGGFSTTSYKITNDSSGDMARLELHSAVDGLIRTADKSSAKPKEKRELILKLVSDLFRLSANQAVHASAQGAYSSIADSINTILKDG